MNLFRGNGSESDNSEDNEAEAHIVRWLAGRDPGATISVSKICELAHEWWIDRLSPNWRPHTRDYNQAILERLDLTGAFWQLP